MPGVGTRAAAVEVGGEQWRDSGRVAQVERGFLVKWMWGVNEDKRQERLGCREPAWVKRDFFPLAAPPKHSRFSPRPHECLQAITAHESTVS